MKLILLSLFTVAVLFQTGCASRPSIDDQSRQAQKDAETATKSDAFAKQLAQ
jgi:hypothetical protein